MKILAIETSCDETAVAILEAEGGKKSPSFCVLGNALYSQASKHDAFGGVYPSLAKREHAMNLVSLLLEALRESEMLLAGVSEIPEGIDAFLDREPEMAEQIKKKLSKIERPNIDAIAVTQGPGLEPALWVGINFAKVLSTIWNIPLIPVNHMEGHILSVLMHGEHDVVFPALALLVSGGHTELVLMKNWMMYKIIGQTRDDAVGEAFDKVARMLGLPYPGGPEISRLAEESRKRNGSSNAFSLPRPMLDSDDYDFSYSGLKTAVLYLIKDKELSEQDKQDIACEFEDAAIEVLIKKTEKAIDTFGAQSLIVGGGVIANKHLRAELKKIEDVILLMPSMELATDNAVMIGMAAYFQYVYKKGKTPLELVRAEGNMKLE